MSPISIFPLHKCRFICFKLQFECILRTNCIFSKQDTLDLIMDPTLNPAQNRAILAKKNTFIDMFNRLDQVKIIKILIFNSNITFNDGTSVAA